MNKLLKISGLWLLILGLYVPQGRAQENPQTPNTKPTQPLKPDQPLPPDEKDANAPTANNEDANVIPAVVTTNSDTPLTGALSPSTGGAPNHSFLIPRFDFFSSVNTNGPYSTGNGRNQVVTSEYLLGGITLQKVGEANLLIVNYVGGRSFSPNGDTYNATTHLFGMMDKWTGRRWSALVSDQLSYASDAYFSGGGAGSGIGAPSLGVSGINIQPSFNPGQTIIVGRTPVLDNNSVGEVDYQANRHGSFTFVGSYNMLHYYGTGLTNNYGREFEVGYNYQVSQRDTVSVSYLFDAIRFSRNIELINENVVQASYRHQFRRRFLFQASGGPAFVSTTATGFPSSSYATWSLSSSLAYTRNRTNLGLSYYHMVTGGAGIFIGSNTDSVSGAVGRQFGRFWSVNANVGYSRNTSLNSFLTTLREERLIRLVQEAGYRVP